MPEHHQPDFLIVGAGVCGLTVADRLAAAGSRVTVIEREDQLGGLARTFHYPEGNFDIGPHRFHTTDETVLRFLDEVLGDDVLHIPRTSLVYFFRHYYRWPIHPTLHLLRLPPRLIVGVVLDLLFRLYRKRRPSSFEDYILNMYGRTLYRAFFRDYSTKFLGITPSETHADWARTGIDRAIIDERLKINTLFELIKSLFVRPKGAEIQFRYPRGGIDVFAKKLRDRIVAAGGDVLLGTPADGVVLNDERITEVRAGGRTWQPKHVVWTASPTALLDMAGETKPDLHFLNLVCFNVVTTKHHGPEFQWCYFGSQDLVFSRVSRPEAFDPDIIAGGRSGLCVEVSSPPEAWDHPEAFQDQVLDDLIRVDLITGRQDVVAVHIEKVRESYPIYDIGYDEKLAALRDRMARVANLSLAGRTGTFWYNNMDHSIAMGLQLAEKLTPGPL
ncbi:MAG: FAD-dependent oxidoreductase [Candidatus Lernaella stagnicola]|nr:FAD-dependent oxidoreductase [Candidatus Lernaella stagnicola]